DNKGVSLVLINTYKGNNTFKYLNNKRKYKNITKVKPFNGGLGGNISIFSNRKYFFDNLYKEPLEELYKNSNNTKYNVGIVNMAFQDNYGGALTYYALYKVIEQLGYNPLLIYDNKLQDSLYNNFIGNKFHIKYSNIANEYFSEEILNQLNENCDTFIVGSDQVWRYDFFEDNIFYYLFNFTNNSKKKISYSSSFGIPTYNGGYCNKLLFKNYLKQFDYVSVREDDGINICKNEFDVEATHVLDPVFLLDVKYYDYLISKSKLNIKYKYVASYLRRGDSNIDKYLSFVSDKLSLKVFKTGRVDFSSKVEYDKSFSIEDWLYMIKNCDFFISDSFHGICFAIIFNKPFILVINDGAISKYKSLIRMFKLENRTINKFYEILEDTNIINTSMDFEQINEKLELEKKKSLEWLVNALETPKKINKDSYKDDMINLLIEKNQQLNNENKQLSNKINYLANNINWLKFFGIYNSKNYIYIYLFGIKVTIKATEKNINMIAWWIPVKKWRESFKDKFRKLY
ncbi:polysaccharide pyruvyl transferase family protein, partial [uncultured Brachyspira sp.]|uniref:polysaccharide pyruvyl transferase family protein n=1 Tax=uncultured Brachyspira sp. TaxID=221953 RepID=UPI0026370A7D